MVATAIGYHNIRPARECGGDRSDGETFRCPRSGCIHAAILYPSSGLLPCLSSWAAQASYKALAIQALAIAPRSGGGPLGDERCVPVTI